MAPNAPKDQIGTVSRQADSGQGRMSWPSPNDDLRDFRRCPAQFNLAQEVLRRGADDRPAILHEGGTVTFAQLRQWVRRTAGGLAELGLRPGDSLLILDHNNLECVLAFLGALHLGAVAVLANSMLRAEELAHIADNSGARTVLAYEGALPAVRTAAESGVGFSTIVAIGTDPQGDEVAFDVLLEGEEVPEPAPTGADDPAFMVYSSGTTGRPKGIVHAHRWIRTMGDPIALRNRYSVDDVILATGEFSFVAVLGSGLLHPLRAGAAVALMDGRPKPDLVLDRIERHKATVMYSVPTLYRMLLRYPDLERDHDLSSLRWVSSAGEALTAALFHEWEDRVGCTIYETYGVSELQMLVANGPDLPPRAGSVGKVLPGIAARVLDDDGQEVPPGAEGLLAVDADDPGLSLGYRDQETQWQACFRGGWFMTEDLFTYDSDGYLWHVGRAGDMFKSRGYLIAPAEIEAALQSHPAVAESAAVGVDDDAIGKRIVAFVVPSSPVEDEVGFRAEVTAFLADQLAPYKLPREIALRDALPRSNQGKLLRRDVS